MQFLKNTTTLITIEFQKLKSTAVLYLIFFGILLISIFAFFPYYFDVYALAALDVNPWEDFYQAASAIYAIFLICPFLIFLISTMIFVEQKANYWKVLYTLPVQRGALYLSKLLAILLLHVLNVILLFIALYFVAQVLNFLLPEFEFNYHSPPLKNIFQSIGHIFLASLGVLGIQYFLALYFKHYLIALGFGLFGFVLALILITSGTEAYLYVPYAYPMMVKDFGLIPVSESFTEPKMGLNVLECLSLGVFVFFVLLAYLWERRRAVSD